MTRCTVACLAALLLSGCGKPEPEAELVLRVSASHGLGAWGSLVAGGSTTYAQDLTFVSRFDSLIEHPSATQLSITLLQQPRDDSFCKSLCIPNAKGIWSQGEACVIDFYSEEDKLEHIKGDLIQVGPFRLRKQEKADPANGIPRDRIDLFDECNKTRIDVIRIEAMTADEEWKEIFARKIDVVPLTSITSRKRFENMGSVHTVVVPPSADMGLYFNTAREPWSSLDARRQIGATITPQSIAEVACSGEPLCIIDAVPMSPPDAPVALPKEVSIVVMASESSLVRAARALQYHLSTKLGMKVTLHELPLNEAIEKLAEDNYDFTLLPITRTPSKLAIDMTRYLLEKHAHYTSPQLDQAVQSLDLEMLDAYLQKEVPAIRLYANVQFAAIDKRFCREWEPDSQTSWRWLAHVVECTEPESR